MGSGVLLELLHRHRSYGAFLMNPITARNSPVLNEQRRALVAELPVLKHRLFELGLIKSSHVVDQLMESAGYELADILKTQKRGKA